MFNMSGRKLKLSQSLLEYKFSQFYTFYFFAVFRIDDLDYIKVSLVILWLGLSFSLNYIDFYFKHCIICLFSHENTSYLSF
jgi:hypothetical protein